MGGILKASGVGEETSSNSFPYGFKNKNIGKVNTHEQDTVKQRRFSSDPNTIVKAYKDIISKNVKVRTLTYLWWWRREQQKLTSSTPPTS